MNRFRKLCSLAVVAVVGACSPSPDENKTAEVVAPSDAPPGFVVTSDCPAFQPVGATPLGTRLEYVLDTGGGAAGIVTVSTLDGVTDGASVFIIERQFGERRFVDPLPHVYAAGFLEAGNGRIDGESGRLVRFLDTPTPAIATLKPGQTKALRAEEETNFGGIRQTLEGTYDVTLQRCGTLPFKGVREPVRVYHYMLFGRSRNSRADPPTDQRVTGESTAYVSHRLGVVLATTGDGTLTLLRDLTLPGNTPKETAP